MIPHILYIALTLIGLGMEIAKHGEIKKQSKHNAWTTLISSSIIWIILYFGGFFDIFLK